MQLDSIINSKFRYRTQESLLTSASHSIFLLAEQWQMKKTFGTMLIHFSNKGFFVTCRWVPPCIDTICVTCSLHYMSENRSMKHFLSDVFRFTAVHCRSSSCITRSSISYACIKCLLSGIVSVFKHCISPFPCVTSSHL